MEAHAGPATVNLAEPATARVPTALARQTIANLAVPGVVTMVPVMAPVMAPAMVPVVAPVMAPGGQVIGNLAGGLIPTGGALDIAGALGRSGPPMKSDMCYKIWEKL